jgi:rare lipoprotein A
MAALGCLGLANCTNTSSKLSSKVDPRLGVSASPRVVEYGQLVPKGGGAYRVGKPYVVAGRTYYPTENKRYRGEGIASWYGDDFHGRLTANGEIYDMDGVSAAHPTLPMPSYARVTNLRNGRSLIVRVNDRGPYHADREIDLSRKAADLLDYRGKGLARVRVEYVGPASLDGSDDRRLMATLREGGPATAPSSARFAAARPPPLGPTVAELKARASQRAQEQSEEEQADVEQAAPPTRVAAQTQRAVRAEPLPEISAPREVRTRAPEPIREASLVPVQPERGRGVPVAMPEPTPSRSGRSAQEPRMVWTTGPSGRPLPAASAYAPTEAAVRSGRGLY